MTRPSNSKMPIPRHRIPPAVLICTRCGSGTKVKTASPFADGYHRRHDCRDELCGFHFYSLAYYDSGKIAVSPLPFKDRPLSPMEVAQRRQWMIEDEAASQPVYVTPQVTEFAHPLVKQLNDAILKAEAQRNETDDLLVSVFLTLKDELYGATDPAPLQLPSGPAAHSPNQSAEIAGLDQAGVSHRSFAQHLGDSVQREPALGDRQDDQL